MAKQRQRRPPARTVKPPIQVLARTAPPSDGNASISQSGSTAPVQRLPQPTHQAQPVQRRSTYFEAVAVYERGMEALQRHDYRAATELLESVLRLYPEEKELHERVRLYLNVCHRHVAPDEASPQTVDERLYAATLAINGGQYDQAIAHLRLVRDEDPDNDHALYMLAVAHAQRDEHAEAVAHLERAIALNPENRALARTDPDLEPLHDDETFRGALEAPPAVSQKPLDRRRPFRARTAR